MTQEQPICEHCHGDGVLFEHSRDCRDDLCALNGDEHSCNGEVVPCGCSEMRAPVCNCQNPEPASGAAGVSEDCPIHGDVGPTISTVGP